MDVTIGVDRQKLHRPDEASPALSSAANRRDGGKSGQRREAPENANKASQPLAFGQKRWKA